MEGAKALAIPLKLGQQLSVNKHSEPTLIWKAYKPDCLWFQAKFDIDSLEILSLDNDELASKLKSILLSSLSLSSNSFLKDGGIEVETKLDFNPEFGFGTSSTLISNLALWAEVDPYELLKITFGGSGYDIACAGSKSPILFQKSGDFNLVTDVVFRPTFHNRLYFVYLGNKQSSSSSIHKFKNSSKFSNIDIDTISQITNEIIAVKEVSEFEDLIAEHENIMSHILNLPTAKQLHLDNYTGAVKSLGAWGGDFVLVTGSENESEFRKTMKEYGFDTLYTYNQLAL